MGKTDQIAEFIDIKVLKSLKILLFLSNICKVDTGYRIQDTGYRIQDTGYRIKDTGYRIQDGNKHFIEST